MVVWIHGGGWKGGDKRRNPAIMLLPKGYAVVSVNYRLSQHATMPAQIEDCKAAIRWVRAHAKEYNLNPERIGVWGASAGGHLVALLGTAGDVKELEGKLGNEEQSSRVQCVVDWFGPSDFLSMGRTQEKADSPVAMLLGGPLSEKSEAAASVFLDMVPPLKSRWPAAVNFTGEPQLSCAKPPAGSGVLFGISIPTATI